MIRSSRLCAALVVLSMSSACRSSNEDMRDAAIEPDTGIVLPLRPAPDTVVIGPGQLRDAVRVGDHVAVLDAFVVYLSHDGGRTWAPRHSGTRLRAVQLDEAGTPFVLAEDGSVRVLGEDGIGEPLGSIAGAEDRVEIHGDASGMIARVGRAWSRFDFATRTVRTAAIDGSVWTSCEWRLSSYDGTTFGAICWRRDEVCHVSWSPDDGTSIDCTDRASWPASAYTAYATLAGPDGAWLLLGEAGRVSMRRVLGPPLSLGPAIDLGPGVLGPFPGSGNGHTFPGLTSFSGASGTLRMVELAADGPRVIDPPAIPCEVATDCPTLDPSRGTLVALLPPSGGRYLGIHTVYVDSMIGDVLVARIAEDGAPVGRSFEEPLPGTVDRGIPPDEAPGDESPLELQCVRAVSCFPHVGVEGCVDFWIEGRGDAEAGLDARFDAFLAATDCASIGAAFPELAAARDGSCAPGCLGDRIVLACGAGLHRMVDCAAYGRTCEVGATGAICAGSAASCGCEGDVAHLCEGGVPYLARDCAAEGGTCRTAAGETACVRPAPTVCLGGAPGAVCRGWGAALCDYDGTSLRAERVCSRANLPCGPTLLGQCGSEATEARTCRTGAAASCDGDVLLYCVGAQQRFVDCAALGGSCESTAIAGVTDARCAIR